MRTYSPDAWVILRLTSAKGVVHKVFGGWYGGFVSGFSWKLSSGITGIRDCGDRFEFENQSGSVYVCAKHNHRMSGYMASLYIGWKEEAAKNGSGVKIESVPLDQTLNIPRGPVLE